ncbi:MAG: hypothetical protein HY646_08980 [Acidobacteria bacterium]|nr:hypothetical protein [Acidobacteriota bacterium]
MSLFFAGRLFLVAGVDFGEVYADIRHPQTWQRAIETATDTKRFFTHFPYKGSGEYLPTVRAFEESVRLFGKLPQVYRSLRKKDFNAVAGCFGNPEINIEYMAGEISRIVIDGGKFEFPNAKSAVDHLRSATVGCTLSSETPVDSLEALIYSYRPLPSNNSWNVSATAAQPAAGADR